MFAPITSLTLGARDFMDTSLHTAICAAGLRASAILHPCWCAPGPQHPDSTGLEYRCKPFRGSVASWHSISSLNASFMLPSSSWRTGSVNGPHNRVEHFIPPRKINSYRGVEGAVVQRSGQTTPLRIEGQQPNRRHPEFETPTNHEKIDNFLD
ncbi:hypothetical protein CI102_3639 [Trichoderma harzianum]|uniref:Uncharacterized protein n=1 Tax=Trichoderma harzianum CBS 226.95 TaxID=983964 RepID=A0A2T4ACD3_TRIHA|nr:hypothetical protein M431DRAFT_494806 [Trichoderma harzianum CBS 226.95]PKK51026.1 hypothetical protein CI102_3639 [Trichoderma harzianum]PTB54588.1 hypothetical protein M431DRAFT_494806 [Trichoderma harzianum CBS 226.95]